MFQSPGAVAFNIFGFSVYYYGIIMAFAIGIGCFTAYKLYEKFYDKTDAAKIFDFTPYIIIVGILGARIYYCAVNYSYYINHPLDILNIRQGGLSIHGMLIAGISALYIFSKVYKISFLKLADVFCCAVAFGQSIGRWGNFFNSEAFGYPSDLPWKLFIPPADRPLEYINVEYFHPTFLYESILDFLLFLTLVVIFKKCSKKAGVISCLYLLGYSFIRILVEHFRIDSVLNIAGVPVAQVMSLVLIFAAILGLFLINSRKS